MNLNAEVKKQFFKTFEILKTTLSVDQIPEILSLTSYSVYAEFDAVKTVSSTGENEILKYFQDFVQRHNLIWVNAPVLKAAAHSFSDILRSFIIFYGEHCFQYYIILAVNNNLYYSQRYGNIFLYFSRTGIHSVHTG